MRKQKNENFTFFYFGLNKNEQIKATLKYLSTSNVYMSIVSLNITFQTKQHQTLRFRWNNTKHYVSDETTPILTSKYSVHHAHRCCAHKGMTLYTCKSSVHFDKTWLWFRFTLSSSSVLPRLHDQCTNHKCLPFSPFSPPTFLIWLRCGVTGITVRTVWAGCHYYTFQKHCVISLHFLRNDSADRSLLLYIPKT
jgi:hypothetical protein